MRTLTYAQAIREAHAQLLSSDPRVFLIGQGLWSPWYAGSSLKDIETEFGRHRILDSPVSENGTTGAAVGAAIAGMRPIVFHPRMDFMLLAMDPIVNQAVPEDMYTVEIGTAAVRRRGTDITIVATSYMAVHAARASDILSERDVDVELIDLRSIKPWDQELVCSSVRKTGCLVVADAAWESCGIAAEIAATVAQKVFNHLKAPIVRVCLPDVPAPTSAWLERAYYIGSDDVISAVHEVLALKEKAWRTVSHSLIQKSTTTA